MSEGLERYRVAKAQLAEIELAKRQAETVSLPDAIRAMEITFECLDRAADRLDREIGHEAALILREAVSEGRNQLDHFKAGTAG